MKPKTLLDEYIGKAYIKVCDEIEAYAKQHGKTLLPMEPTDFNIDVEPNRINVWLDATGTITHFTYG